MATHKITGGGGIQLQVMEAGDPKGRPILFIHGFSMCGLCWKNQMNSRALNNFRLIFLDIRGHGLSDKPKDAYGDTVFGGHNTQYSGDIIQINLDRFNQIA